MALARQRFLWIGRERPTTLIQTLNGVRTKRKFGRFRHRFRRGRRVHRFAIWRSEQQQKWLVSAAFALLDHLKMFKKRLIRAPGVG